jgi:hypothetical protein
MIMQKVKKLNLKIIFPLFRLQDPAIELGKQVFEETIASPPHPSSFTNIFLTMFYPPPSADVMF